MISYSEAVERAGRLQAADGAEVNPLCRTRILAQAEIAERSLVLFHGITNCPQQFDALAAKFSAMGYSVLVPRYPRHGLADRLNRDQERLTAGELTALAGEAAVIASGLGRHVTVAGISLGGVISGWLAQHHPEVQAAALVAPLLAVRNLPVSAAGPFRRVIAALPNRYFWWDGRLRSALEPSHGYPRIASHAFAALLEVGQELLGDAARSAPKARSVGVVVNRNDPGVNNGGTDLLVQRWRRQGATIETYDFPSELGLPHDIVDPANPQERTAVVYPVLIGIIERLGPPAGASSPARAASGPSSPPARRRPRRRGASPSDPGGAA